MNSEHWDRVSRLYGAAWALDSSQRTAFLAEACGHDEALHKELASLVGQSGVETFLASPAADGFVGRDIGAYPVLTALDRGPHRRSH
jgi:hypothetical protein